jgi:hypothetical protein
MRMRVEARQKEKPSPYELSCPSSLRDSVCLHRPCAPAVARDSNVSTTHPTSSKRTWIWGVTRHNLQVLVSPNKKTSESNLPLAPFAAPERLSVMLCRPAFHSLSSRSPKREGWMIERDKTSTIPYKRLAIPDRTTTHACWQGTRSGVSSGSCTVRPDICPLSPSRLPTTATEWRC